MKVGVELPQELINLIDCQAQKDGHRNRCAVIRKALNLFLDGSTQDKTPKIINSVAETTFLNITIQDNIISLIDKKASMDGHSNRSAVIRKALCYFFAPKV